MTPLLIACGTGFLGKRLGLALRDRYDVVLGAHNQKQAMLGAKLTGVKAIPLGVANAASMRDVGVEIKPLP